MPAGTSRAVSVSPAPMSPRRSAAPYPVSPRAASHLLSAGRAARIGHPQLSAGGPGPATGAAAGSTAVVLPAGATVR